jgi:biotin carboxylase
MATKKRIMILGAGVLQRPGILKAKDMGYEVVAVDMDPNAVGFQDADIKLVISTIDIPAVLEAAKEYHIDGIMTLASDMPMRTVACVGSELGLPAISEEAAFRATDKHAMRMALKEHGVPVPAFFGVKDETEYRDAIAQIPGDCFIVKPADSSGSRGVHLVSKDEDALPAFHHSQKFSRSGVVMVEEYMTGPEVSVESLTIDGETQVIAITDKLIVGNGNFTEIGHTQPCALPAQIQEEIRDVVCRTVKAIGIDHSPSHAELKVTPTGVKVVEIGARLGGDNITTSLVPLSTGVDMLAACIHVAMGNPVGAFPKVPNTAAIRYFDPPVGTIRDIRNVEQARSIPGICEIQILRSVGQRVVPITSSTDRIGFVIAQGCSGRTAAEICEEAMSMIHFEIGGKE